MSREEKTSKTIVTRQQSNFISNLPTTEVHVKNENVVLYTPVTSTSYFIPLIIERKDGMLLITSQDNLDDDQLFSLFGDEPYVNDDATYKFVEQALMDVLDDQAEEICEVVALLQKNTFVDEDALIEVFKALIEEGYGINDILKTLHTITGKEFKRLIRICEEERYNLKHHFNRLLGDAPEYDDDDYSDDDEEY